MDLSYSRTVIFNEGKLIEKSCYNQSHSPLGFAQANPVWTLILAVLNGTEMCSDLL